MAAEWIKAQTKRGKNAIKAALLAGCYDSSIDYDVLCASLSVPDDITPDKLQSNISDCQSKYKQSLSDQDPKKPKSGRKNRGLTQKHYEAKKTLYKDMRHTPQPETFNNEILEHVTGEIINDFDIDQYKELCELTFSSVLDDFRQNNPDLIKKHPYMYYKKLMIALKKQLPKITANDLDKCIIVWDCLTTFLNDIGLFMTWSSFEQLTNIYKYQLEKKKEQSPKYADFLQKITIDCDRALINELEFNPYNQTNKIFLAKVRGFVEKTEPKQIEVIHNIRNYDTLPMLQDEKT